jgi:hypothetical protein
MLHAFFFVSVMLHADGARNFAGVFIARACDCEGQCVIRIKHWFRRCL